MKKIIAFIITSLSLLPNVLAEEIIWSDKKLEDYKVVEEEKRYKFYKEEKEGEYIKKGEEDKRYTNIDENNTKISDKVEYTDTCSNDSSVLEEYQEVYPYLVIPKAKSLSFQISNKDLNIAKLDIYDKEEKISYEIDKCSNCSGLNIKANSYIKFIFDEEHLVGDLKIVLTTVDNAEVSFYIYFNDKNDYLIKNGSINTKNKEYKVKDYNYSISNFKDINYSLEKPELSHSIYPLDKTKKCTRRDIMTYRYNIVKNYYSEEYYAYIDDTSYIKDEEDYKVYYKYIIEDPKDLEEIKSQIENTDTKLLNNKIEEHNITPVDTGYKKNINSKDTIKIIIVIISFITLAVLPLLIKTIYKRKFSQKMSM